VQRAFEKGQYPLFRETPWKYSQPCMACFHRDGPVWMMKGMGDKSKKKSKGFKKISKKDINNLMS